MNRSEIAWAYWTGLVLVAAIALVLFLRGPLPTTCDSSSVTDTVIDLVKKNSSLPKNTSYELDSIRQTGEDQAAGTLSCEADVNGEFYDTPYATAHLTYKVEKQADGQVMVTVEGIAGLHFP